VAKFKYLGATLTNENVINDEIKSRLNSGNACYHSDYNVSSSRLWFKNVEIKICKSVVLPTVLYECEIWSLTLREEHGMRIFENKVLRRIFGTKREEVIGDWENCILRSFIICTLRQI
jgi:hypothetical protein